MRTSLSGPHCGLDSSPCVEDDKATEMEVIPTVETLSVSMAAAAAACMIGNGLAAVLPPPFAGQSKEDMLSNIQLPSTLNPTNGLPKWSCCALRKGLGFV